MLPKVSFWNLFWPPKDLFLPVSFHFFLQASTSTIYSAFISNECHSLPVALGCITTATVFEGALSFELIHTLLLMKLVSLQRDLDIWCMIASSPSDSLNQALGRRAGTMDTSLKVTSQFRSWVLSWVVAIAPGLVGLSWGKTIWI